MSAASLAQLADYVAQLRRLPVKGKGGTESPLDSLERRLRTAITRNTRGGLVEVDGYPSTASGADRSGGGTATLTSVESAAARRIAAPGPGMLDPLDHLTRDAAQHLEEAVMHLNACRNRLDSIDEMTGVDTKPRPRTCEVCTGKRGEGNDQVVEHSRTTVSDRLTLAADLCADCYAFVRQTAPAASRDGYLPTDAQVRHHQERGRWQVRTAPRSA